MIVFQAWTVVGVFLAVFIFLYADELPRVIDWVAWNIGGLVINIRLKLWKIWLYPKLRIETYFRARHARARQRAIMAKESNH
jgi:hypothetical protein